MASDSIVGQPPGPPRPWCQRLREENDSLAKLILARRPEERLINDYAEVQATVRKLATVVAYLSLTWSTVVLLGGFVPVLKLIDFWFLTAVSTAFALNLADLFEYKIAFGYAARNLYVGLCDYLARRYASTRSRGVVCLVVICSVIAENSLGVLFIGGIAVLYILTIIVPLVAIVLSLVRLVVHRYGNAGGDVVNAAKLKASLEIFYSLALLQNTFFGLWSLCLLSRIPRAIAVSKQCGFGKWGVRLVRRYLSETISICATEGAVPRDRNLGTFALGLVGSKFLDDHRDAVRMLDTLVRSRFHQDEVGGVGPHWLHYCSEDGTEKLIKALAVGNDGKTRERAARIVVAFAGGLRHIDHFPTALDHIGSLLQAFDAQSHGKFPTVTETRTSTEEDKVRRKRRTNGPVYWGVLCLFNIPDKRIAREENNDDVILDGQPKLLISQGLLIIERIALHQGNCVHICNNHVLLSKLTAPLYSHAFLDAEHDSDWIDIHGSSLRIVAMLTKTPGEAGRGLRDGIASNTQAISNLTRILEDDKFGAVLKTAAIDILASLASSSHNSATGLLDIKRYISRLWGIFLAGRDEIDNNTIQEEGQRRQDSRLRHKAGEALAQMISVWIAAASSSDILEIFVQSPIPSVTKYKDGGSSSEEVLTAAFRHVVGQLTDMLNKSKSARTMAARILECLCSHLSTKYRKLPSQDVIEMLTKVLQLILHIPCETNKLEMAVQVKICSPGETNNNSTGIGATKTNDASSKKDEEQQEEKDFLVAILELAVAICDRMVDAHDFTCAAPQDIVPLVKKLKDIIQTNNTTTVECLRTVKLTCQLVVSMVQLNPMCIEDFTEHNFKDILAESLKILSDLDNCLILYYVDDNHQVTKTEKPLVSLVKQAQELFHKAQEPGNVLA